MIPLDDIRIYLPKYLSKISEDDLFEDLTQFEQASGNRNYYTRYRHPDLSVICQGDGINDLLLINLPSSKIQPGPGMIVSNTCDVDIHNKRLRTTSACYCPIFRLSKYKAALLGSGEQEVTVNKHIESIRLQRVSNFFYLPLGGGLEENSFVAFDKICNCSSEAIPRQTVEAKRIFTLSNFGFYLFLLKLSIHFTRIREGIDRDIPSFDINPN